ncbi:LPD7 domain-containing protein [Roseateles oligotrophus]|uniref:Large polyvalent protein-associated domain-containing protein n=1 Tax=Roseateles oligotrophus TaxID=1769250 RepID=A0ABT2YBD8_9BURK|nr:LPD7 domain-containing protein [Roseateles oligotrophus]MCV2366977.1 hypothetical protein [Roseateles oligotrophus]
MNTETGRAAHKPGGSVEPIKRANAATPPIQQAPTETAGQRYELYDPFAEVTYRIKGLEAMSAKADQLGASRFHAVDEDGKRTPVEKVNGQWQKQQQQRPIEQTAPPKSPSSSNIDLTADRAARAEQLTETLQERYLIKRPPMKLGEIGIGHTEYRYRGDSNRVAFTESAFKLSTDNNNPSVARSMVDVAESRNWKSLRVSGNEDFKRLIWLEASLRGIKAHGYEPQRADQELLSRERDARMLNRIEHQPAASGANAMSVGKATANPAKQSARGGGGRKAVLAALEAVLVAKHVPEKQRLAVMSAAADNLAQRLQAGQTLKVKVFDKAAPSQRPVAVPTLVPEAQRSHERAVPGR